MFKNERLLIYFYQSYSKHCYETGNLKEAYNYLNKSFELEKKLNQEDVNKNTNDLINQFEEAQKQKELEIYRLKNVELAHSQKTIENKNVELIKLNEEKDNILGMISHDLKNYIGVTLSAHEVLTTKDKSSAENKYIRMINETSNKALSLVRDILIMNKIDLDEKSIPLTKQDIHLEIDFILENLALMAKRKNINIVKDYYPEPIFCLIHKERFQRAIDNICINALKFINDGGELTVKTHVIDQIAFIHIKDNGIGMDDEMIKNLFQLDTKIGRIGTAGEESSGLGLYIVKKILDSHQAEIEVFSEVGKGSEFVIKMGIR